MELSDTVNVGDSSLASSSTSTSAPVPHQPNIDTKANQSKVAKKYKIFRSKLLEMDSQLPENNKSAPAIFNFEPDVSTEPVRSQNSIHYDVSSLVRMDINSNKMELSNTVNVGDSILASSSTLTAVPHQPNNKTTALKVSNSAADVSTELVRPRVKRVKRVKSFAGQIICKCRRDCAHTIDILQQKILFDAYSLGTWQDRTLFLRKSVSRIKKENLYINPLVRKRQKKYEYIYSLKAGDNEVHRVCLSFFSKLFQLNLNTIRNAFKSVSHNPEGIDNRGKFPKKKVPIADIEFVENFIGGFQSYESSYRSRDGSKKYLHPKLNLLKSYKQYKSVCAFKKRKSVSRASFNRIFRRDFSFDFPPKAKLKNCSTCHTLEHQLLKPFSQNIRSKLKLQRKKHLNSVQMINKKFIVDITEAEFIQSNVEIITFEICLPFDLPSLSQNDSIMQSRQFWQFLMLIHDEIRDRTHVYTWPESVASKGSSEITSCIRKYITSNLSPETEKIILYSDPLSGQNRNSKICLMLMDLLHSWPHDSLKTIEQRFFLKGHARNKCNVDFCYIEKRKKAMQSIFSPVGCVDLINNSKNTNPRFSVNEMECRDFLSLQPLVNLFKESEVNEIDFSNIQTIIYERSEPFTIKCRAYEWTQSTIVPMNIGLKNMEHFPVIALPQLYPEGRAISKAKYDDLQTLSQFIPLEYHEFYKNLIFEETDTLKDFALSLKESSDEEE